MNPIFAFYVSRSLSNWYFVKNNNGSMELFDFPPDRSKNLLPYQGIVNYYGRMIPGNQADAYLRSLLQGIEWKNDEAVIFGKKIITKRKVAWYGDSNFGYTYSHITKQALPWTRELMELKTIAEQTCGETFNSCLLNLYHNGEESMGWHSDAEKDLKTNAAIASISFGAERKFMFRNKENKESISLTLQHGSLLVMKDVTQAYWLHRLPPAKKITTPRINLTFRTINGPSQQLP